MTDLQATLDAINELAVHECGHCRRPLRPDGASPDFCGPWCQEEWLRAKQEVVELVGYREPWDLPQHVGNLVELSSPEVTPRFDFPTGGLYEMQAGFHRVGESLTTVTYRLEVDMAPLRAAFEAMSIATERAWADLRAAWDRMTPNLVVFDEIHHWRWQSEQQAADAPVEVDDQFGADFDFEWRPARTLPDAPPPAAQRARTEPDWQAMADAGRRTGPSSQPFERRSAP
jgi:hypothetical protein